MASRVGRKWATIEDLIQTPEKAELIGGRIVKLMPTGRLPNRVAGNIYLSLRSIERQAGGESFTDNIGYVVPRLASGRSSFSPDVSFFGGPFSETPMKFLQGAPRLAVEVRSEGDDGPKAELEIAKKRADYFEAGTLVVWDVDPIAGLIHSFRPHKPDAPTTYRFGQVADADPAVPGWRPTVDELFAT